MSDKPAQSETTPPATPPPAAPPPRKPSAPSRARRDHDKGKSGAGGIAVLALLLAVVALALAGWQWWQQRQGDHVARQLSSRVEERVAALGKQVDSVRDATRAGQARADRALESVHDALDQKAGGLSRRVGSLEDAVTSLSRHRRDGREAALLDQAALLLRLGQQRQELFGDADGAIKAYDQAEQTLQAANDPELGDVIASVRRERKSLRDSRPVARRDALRTVAQLRDEVETWPLKADAGQKPAAAPEGFWQRVWHGLATTVVVHRADAPTRVRTDARMAHQLVALDLAQAQMALLAWDTDAAHDALQHAATRLTRDFDNADAGVRKARDAVAGLLKQSNHGTAAQLGQALHALSNLRGVRDVAPAADDKPDPDAVNGAAKPAQAGSAGVGHGSQTGPQGNDDADQTGAAASAGTTDAPAEATS